MKIFSMKNKSIAFLKKVLPTLIILLIWQFTAVLIGKTVYYPSFTQTFQAFMNLASSNSFWIAASVSLFRIFAGFASALFIGVFLAILCALIPSIESFTKTVIGVAKATPVASFIILAMIWFHTSSVPVFVGILMIAPIIFENTLQGIQNIDHSILEMRKVYTIPTSVFIKKIALPYTKPYLTSAISLSLGIGFKAVISAEILARPTLGIGSGIYDAKIYLETPDLFALTLTVIILSLILEKVIGKIILKTNKGHIWT